LGELAATADEAGVRAPAIVVVGAVAGRSGAIAGRRGRPRPARRGGVAAARRRLGAYVVELPAIRSEPRIDSDEVRRAVDDLYSYALVCLTSPNGVELLFEAMAAAGRDARALANATVAAIGPGTAAALREHGVLADVVPAESVAEAMVEALSEIDVEGRPVLVARAAEGWDGVPGGR